MRKPDAWRAANEMAYGGWNYYDADTFVTPDKEPLYRRTDADRAVLLEAAEACDELAMSQGDEYDQLAAKLREMAS